MSMSVGFKEIWAKFRDETDLEWKRKRREKWVLKKNCQFEKKNDFRYKKVERDSNP